VCFLFRICFHLLFWSAMEMRGEAVLVAIWVADLTGDVVF
jgi:hypothetical protein